MRTVTIALLCFLLLVALDIGRVVASSEFFPLVVRRLQIAVSYLYWEICWEVYYQFTHNFEGVPLYLRFISLLICIYLTFALYVYIKYTYWIGPHPEADQDHPHEPAEKGQSQETKLPVTPIVPHITPPPVTLPPTELAPPSYPPPFEFPFTNFRGTGESFAHSDRRDPTHYSVSQLSISWANTRRKERDHWRSAPRQPSPAYRSTEHEKVAAAPTIPKPEVAQIATKSTKTTTKDHVVIAPAHKVVELPPIYIPSPTQTPSTLPSAPSIDPQLGALRDVEDKKHLVVAEMKSFLSTIGTDAGCEAPAARILALMVAAKMHLMPFFQGGLYGLHPDFLIWKDAIVDFWCRFRPYGWEIREDEDGRLRTFLQQYRDTAIWLGLEHYLDDLTVVAKPAQPPASSTQEPPAPKMGTLSAIPTTTEYLPAPAIPIAPQPQKAPSTSAPIQQAPTQQPIVPQGAPGLIDFSNEDWFGLPDDQLKELKWRSFNWPNQKTASLKIWHYNVLELTQLPTRHPEFIMASYVKAELEKAAPLLKRASVVFRLQGRRCQWPGDLEMAPLIGSITSCISRATEMTNQCQEIADWYSRDEWYQACQYFHKNVFKDKRVWASLCSHYDSKDPDEEDKEDKTGPLRRLWEKMSPTWLPDIAKR